MTPAGGRIPLAVETDDTLLTLHGLADRFKLPPKSLKDQAKAGRLPHLRVGRHYRFNAAAVKAALLVIAAETPPRPAGEVARVA